MFTNRFILVLGLLSLLLVTVVVSKPISNATPERINEATDFYQRHPGWTWAIDIERASIPATGASAFPDYYQRHLELSMSPIVGLGASDYFQRHPELIAPAEAFIDMTDYYFRHRGSLPTSTTIDLTDYFFRH